MNRRVGEGRVGRARRAAPALREPASTLSLRVVEGAAKDVGRGIARLDPLDLARLGASVGDVLAIAGERRTVVKALPAFAEHRGKGLIQIDGVTRGNARVGIDQRVEVSRTAARPAERVALRPLGDAPSLKRGAESRYLVRLLESLPLLAGDRVRVTLFGTRHLDFEVTHTLPRDVALVVAQPQTRVTVEADDGTGRRAAGVSYEDVGGVRKEIRRIREMVELPLRYPQLFQKLGIDAPKGVLLHGPPGTGKTLLARAVAHETEVAFLSVSGPEVIHKFYGESEAKLRGLFEQARQSAPCIVFIDEIDAIAPKREHVHGEVERRVVAQLLALMDGLKGRGQVIVIGATNLPDTIDAALRRPGRFDREIEIGVPDAAARREILEIHTRGMPLAPDVELSRLAAAAHGFVGADLQALCREAAMTTLREVIPEIDLGSELSEDLLPSLQVNMSHFTAALAEIEPSAIRELVAEVPEVAWEDVGGLDEVKRELREAVEWPLRHPELVRQAGLRPPKGVLLYGEPGTGKTLLAKALASQSGVNFLSVKGPALLSKYVGESESRIRDLFRKARQAAPCVLLFDEIDALAPKRTLDAGDSHVAERVLGQLLTELDGVEELKGVLVLGATNRRDMLDPALLRSGRFDLLLEVGPPRAAERARIFEVHLRGKPLAQDVDVRELAELSAGCTGADIESACHGAARRALRRVIEAAEQQPKPALLSQADLRGALEEQRTARGARAADTPSEAAETWPRS